MSKLTTTAATAHTLSLTAMEEASRLGQRTADIDHLFLALVVSEQRAGQVLRSLGITLDSAREAVVTQHAEQLASLGIETQAPAPGRIVFHETGGYEWGDRALGVIKRAGEGVRSGDATAVLRALVAESSGLIESVLTRLGITSEAVVARLDEVERYPEHASGRATERGRLSGIAEAFAPASGEQVWELLTSPARMPEWEPSIGSVDASDDALRVGAAWGVRSRSERPDGKPVRIKPEFVAQRIELIGLDEGRCIEWRFSYPYAPNSNARLLRIELEPAAGGTQLRLSLAWELHPRRMRRSILRSLLRPLMRPWTRFMIWMQLTQLGSGISRAVR